MFLNKINNILNLFKEDFQLLELTIIISILLSIFGLVILYLVEAYRSDKYKKLYKETSKKLKISNRLKNSFEVELKTFANLLDEITFPIWQRDKNYNIIYCNSKFCEFIDEIREDILQDNSIELYKNSKEFASIAIKTGKTQVKEQHIIVNGSKVLCQIVEIPVSNKPGMGNSKQGTIGFALNFSELQTTRERLKSNLELQNRLLESLASAVAIYDANQRLEYFNKSFAKLFKLDEEWLANAPTYGEILDKIKEKRMLPEQANYKSFREENIEMFNSLISKKEEFYHLPDDSYIKVIIIPYQQRGLLFYYDDMTSNINMERKYNTLVSVQKQTLDNLTEAVAVFAENGRLKLYNPEYEHIWGHQGSLLETEPHYTELLDEEKNLLNIEDFDEFKKEFADKLLNRNIDEAKIIRADNLILNQKFTPLPDGGTLLSYDDITDKENIERSLRAEKKAYEEVDKIKTNFLNNVSYELRSPLTSIMGFSELLLMGTLSNSQDKVTEYLKAIFDSSINLKQLIDNIIDVSSIDAGYMKLDTSSVTVRNFIKEVEKEILTKLNSLDITLNTRITGKLPKMNIDKKRMLDAFNNIFANIITVTEENSEIDFLITSKGQNIHFEVTAKGKGIAKEELHNIFNQFYKIKQDNSSTSSLGLYLVKRIIEMHSGFITAESELGKYTKFVFEIPA